jgi:cytochrome P450
MIYLGAKFKRHTSVLSSLFRRNKIVGYLDTIIECTDKLLDRWRMNNKDPTYVHLDMVKQTQQLLINIFGFIGFDYDLHTLDNENNKLARALHIYINTTVIFTQLPELMGRIYLYFNFKYQRARQIIDQYLNKMIEQELKETSITRVKRKRTSFIASLVTSLHETGETTNVKENKKGRVVQVMKLLYICTISK